MIPATLKNFRGLIDQAVPRLGGDSARIIRCSGFSIAQYTLRTVVTETRREILMGDMPVCWAIVTRLYELDADGHEVIYEREVVITDAAQLENQVDQGIKAGAAAMRHALTGEEVRL